MARHHKLPTNAHIWLTKNIELYHGMMDDGGFGEVCRDGDADQTSGPDPVFMGGFNDVSSCAKTCQCPFFLIFEHGEPKQRSFGGVYIGAIEL